MTLILFKKHLRCFTCGKTVKVSKESMPFCCGQQMVEALHEAPEGADEAYFKADVVEMKFPVILKANWEKQFEVWSFRRSGENDVNKEQIGWLGLTPIGTWEFMMKPGLFPDFGRAFTRAEAVQKMLDIISS